MVSGVDVNDKNAWDDTALIDSWDEALAEYKKYYSIQAKGTRLEDCLTTEEFKDLKTEYGDLIEDAGNRSEAPVTNNHAAQLHPEGKSGVQPGQNVAQAKEPATSAQQGESSTAQPQPMPQAILGSVKDESLRNMIMSWYYAGYYTGLHEGQQKST